MIILNQKKDIIINFSNAISIYAQEKNVQVLMNFMEDALILGKYKTEERAKEIIQEIERYYIKFMQSSTSIYNPPKVYEMPKE